MMRRIFPTSVSSRCGLGRVSGRGDSPEAPSPQPMIQHAPVGVAAPGGRIEDEVAERVRRVLNCTRRSSRAVPSNVAFDRFESVHSINTPSRVMGPGVAIGVVTVYAVTSNPARSALSGAADASQRRILDVHGVELAVRR